jgi:hypothetical protein
LPVAEALPRVEESDQGPELEPLVLQGRLVLLPVALV